VRVSSLNPCLLEDDYRDVWGAFDAAAIRNLEKLARSRCCYEPRYYVAPDFSRQRLTAEQVLETVMVIPAGSFITGIRHAGGGASFLFQVTDVGLNRKWFSHPIPDDFVAQGAGLGGGRDSWQQWFLPELYPVISPGEVLVEFWNTSGATNRIALIFAVAEVVE